MCRPMCAIQEVARTQSVQSITGNSPLSISCQIFVSIWFLDAWFQCQKIFQLSPFSRVFILISKCELSHFISWLNLKWSQFKPSLVRQQKHFIESLKLCQSDFTLVEKVWIYGWICRLDWTNNGRLQIFVTASNKLTSLSWRTKSFQKQKLS